MELKNTMVSCRFIAGTSIEQAIDEAMELQHRLGCVIEFKFNGIMLTVHKWDDYKKTMHSLLNEFEINLKQK